MSLTKQDKVDIKNIVQDVVAESVTPRFDKLETKVTNLDTKVSNNHTIVINHILATKKEASDTQQDFTKFKESIAQAAV
jgi:hypothetical protein